MTLYMRIVSTKDGCQCDLAFNRVPPTEESSFVDFPVVTHPSFGADVGDESCVRARNWEGDQAEVFLGVSDLVDSPEGRVASLVSLVPVKQRFDLRRQIKPIPFNVVCEFSRIGGEREFDAFEGFASRTQRGSVSALVEDGAEIVGRVKEDAGERLRKFARENNLVNFVSGLSIFIDDFGRRAAFGKGDNHGIKIVDVVPCAIERQFRTAEHVGHGRQV